METKTNNFNSKYYILLCVVIAISSVLVGFILWNSNKKEDSASEDALNKIQEENNVPIVDNRKKYKNGMYSAGGNYVSPAGQEEIEITLVINDDKIIEATFEGKATNPVSKKLQTAFSEGFKTVVVGKSIDEISLTVVNGSSLTPKGFMDALSKIKMESEVKA